MAELFISVNGHSYNKVYLRHVLENVCEVHCRVKALSRAV